MALHLWMINAVATAVTAGGQDPSLDFQFALPDTKAQVVAAGKRNSLSTQNCLVVSPPDSAFLRDVFTTNGTFFPIQDLAVSTAPGFAIAVASNLEEEKRVSVKFVNAGVYEVLKWLQFQGFNYVAASTSIDPKITVTLNVENRPLGEVANALASALGGFWDRSSGNTRIFKKGAGWDAPVGMRAPEFLRSDVARSFPVPSMNSFAGARVEQDLAAQFRKMAEEIRMHAQALTKSKPSSKDDEKMRKWAEELSSKMEKEFGADFQKRMREFEKKIQKLQSDTSVYTTPQSRVALPRTNNLSQPSSVAGTIAPADSSRQPQTIGRAGVLAPRSLLSPPAAGTRQPGMSSGNLAVPGFSRVDPATGTRSMLQGQSVQTLLDSLTPAQQAKQKKDGYLKLEDLTSAQRRMIGNPTGNFTIEINSNGRKLQIKSGQNNHKLEGKVHSDLGHEAKWRKNSELFLNSITPAQEEKYRKQGYITFFDLNAEQLKLLGDPTGEVTYEVEVDGRKIKVKSGS